MSNVEIHEGTILELTSPVSMSGETGLDFVKGIRNGLLLHITLDLNLGINSIYGLPSEQRLTIASVLKDICRGIITPPKEVKEAIKEVDSENREKSVILVALPQRLLRSLSDNGVELDTIVPIPISETTPLLNMAEYLVGVGMFNKERKKVLISLGLEMPLTQSEFDNAFGVLTTKLTDPRSFNQNP